MLFGMTLLFSLFLLTLNTWGAPYISFDSLRIGETGPYTGIDIIDTNGKNLRNLTNHLADDTDAAWSPDGRSFAFASNRDESFEIYIKTFNVAQVRRLTNQPEGNAAPTWSPDGNWIAFVSKRTGVNHIYKIDINGKNLQRLTNQGRYNLAPAWSPDGQSIAFESIRNNTLDLYVMDADGKNPRQIINPYIELEILLTILRGPLMENRLLILTVLVTGLVSTSWIQMDKTHAVCHLLEFGALILHGHLMVSGLPTMQE